MDRKASLLTGIPRSGTTLCCRLLNALPDTIALHEPIRPATINNHTVSASVNDIVSRCEELFIAIRQGHEFEHGDASSLMIDNPIGDEFKDGIRTSVAQRGTLKLNAKGNTPFTLVVKQNAMFAALLPHLREHFDVTAIVRNPIDVLLSWLTVDLPINKGRIPGGERFDKRLSQQLDNIKQRIERQWFIYQWFFVQFVNAQHNGLNIVRYEDVIATQGRALAKVFGVKQFEDGKALIKPKAAQREFTADTLEELGRVLPRILSYDYKGLYGRELLDEAIQKHGIIFKNV